jgi:hypothetical protein
MPDPLLGLRPSEPCSSRAAVRRLRRRCPPGVVTIPTADPTRRSHASAARRAMGRPGNAPRLQGLAPHESPPLHGGGLDRRERVALLGFRPPGCSPSLDWQGLRRASPHELVPQGASDLWNALQGFASSEIGSPLSRPPTLLGFLASWPSRACGLDAVRESPPQASGCVTVPSSGHL